MKIKTALITTDKNVSQEVKAIYVLDVSVHGSIANLKDEGYDIVLFDTDHIDINDSQYYLSKLRKRFHNVPVILIVRDNCIKAINKNWYFDDFILYPFRHNELFIRIERLIDFDVKAKESTIKVGNVIIEPDKYTVKVNDQKIILTYKEFELLKLLMENRGVVFTRQQILAHIWGIEYIGGTRTVDVHIRRLRSKLGDEFNNIIETIRNVGYKCRDIL